MFLARFIRQTPADVLSAMSFNRASFCGTRNRMSTVSIIDCF
jgi:hypothetical protein